VQIRRELLDLAKHHRSRVAPIPPGAGPPGESGAGGDPPDHPTWDPRRLAEWAEFHEQAAALPEKPREVFDLLWYQGLSQGEAAEAIGVDVRTVKARWQDARLRLCRVFEGRMPGA
jgi:DNA-directed RNA polymerase specialized sigma24 family protein